MRLITDHGFPLFVQTLSDDEAVTARANPPAPKEMECSCVFFAEKVVRAPEKGMSDGSVSAALRSPTHRARVRARDVAAELALDVSGAGRQPAPTRASAAAAFLFATAAANATDAVELVTREARAPRSQAPRRTALHSVADDANTLDWPERWPRAGAPARGDAVARARFAHSALLERTLERATLSGWLGFAAAAAVAADRVVAAPTPVQVSGGAAAESQAAISDPVQPRGVWLPRLVALTPGALWLFAPDVAASTGVDATVTSPPAASGVPAPAASATDASKTSLRAERHLAFHIDAAAAGIGGSDFQVSSNGEILTLRAASEAEACAWLVQIHSCIVALRHSVADTAQRPPSRPSRPGVPLAPLRPAIIALGDNHVLAMADAVDSWSSQLQWELSTSSAACAGGAGRRVGAHEDIGKADSTGLSPASLARIAQILSAFTSRHRLHTFARRLVPELVPQLRAWEHIRAFEAQYVDQAIAPPLDSASPARPMLQACADIFDRFFARGAPELVTLPSDVLYSLSLDIVQSGAATLSRTQEGAGVSGPAVSMKPALVPPPLGLFSAARRVLEGALLTRLLLPYAKAHASSFTGARKAVRETASLFAAKELAIAPVKTMSSLSFIASRISFSRRASSAPRSDRSRSIAPSASEQTTADGSSAAPPRRASIFAPIPGALTAMSPVRGISRAATFLSPKTRSKSSAPSKTDGAPGPAPDASGFAVAAAGAENASAATSDDAMWDAAMLDDVLLGLNDEGGGETAQLGATPSVVDYSLIPPNSLGSPFGGVDPGPDSGAPFSADDRAIEALTAGLAVANLAWRESWRRSLLEPNSANPSGAHPRVLQWAGKRNGVAVDRVREFYGSAGMKGVPSLSSQGAASIPVIAPVNPGAGSEAAVGARPAPSPAHVLRSLQDAVADAVLVTHELAGCSPIQLGASQRDEARDRLSDFVYGVIFGVLPSDAAASSAAAQRGVTSPPFSLDARQLAARNSHPGVRVLTGALLSSQQSQGSRDAGKKGSSVVPDRLQTKQTLVGVLLAPGLNATLPAPSDIDDLTALATGVSTVPSLGTDDLIDFVAPSVLSPQFDAPALPASATDRRLRVAQLREETVAEDPLLEMQATSTLADCVVVEGSAPQRGATLLGLPVPIVHTQRVRAFFSECAQGWGGLHDRPLPQSAAGAHSVYDVSVVSSAGASAPQAKRLAIDHTRAACKLAAGIKSAAESAGFIGNSSSRGVPALLVTHSDGSLVLHALDGSRPREPAVNAWALFSATEAESQRAVKKELSGASAPSMLGLLYLPSALRIGPTRNASLPHHAIDVATTVGVLSVQALDGGAAAAVDLASAISAAASVKPVTIHALAVGAAAAGRKVRMQVRAAFIAQQTTIVGQGNGSGAAGALQQALMTLRGASAEGYALVRAGPVFKRGKYRTAFAPRVLQLSVLYHLHPTAGGGTAAAAHTPASAAQTPETNLDSLFALLRMGPYKVDSLSTVNERTEAPLVAVRAAEAVEAASRASAAGSKAADGPAVSTAKPAKLSAANAAAAEAGGLGSSISEVRLEYYKGSVMRGYITLWSAGLSRTISVVPDLQSAGNVAPEASGAPGAATEWTSKPAPNRMSTLRRWIGAAKADSASAGAAGAQAFRHRFALHVSGGDGRVWQLACDDPVAAQEWVATLAAFCIPRDGIVSRTLPRTRPGGAGGEDACVRALLVSR